MHVACMLYVAPGTNIFISQFLRKGTKSKKSNEDDPGPDVVMVARASGAALGFHRIQTIRGQEASTQIVAIAHSPARCFAPKVSRLKFQDLWVGFATEQDACQGAKASEEASREDRGRWRGEGVGRAGEAAEEVGGSSHTGCWRCQLCLCLPLADECCEGED